MLRVELKVLEGSQAGKVIPLNVRQFLIGREQDCHLRPNSELVSRHHCVFTVDEFAVRLRDLGSTNGTFLNGERLRGQAVLKAGDRVVVGKLSFEVSIQLSPSPVVAEEPPAAESTAVEDDALGNGATVEFGATTQAEDTAMFAPAGETAAGPAVTLPPGYPPQMGYPPMPYGMPPAGYGMPGYGPQGYPQGYPPPGYPPQYPPMPNMNYMPGYPMPQMMPGYSLPGGMPPAAPPAPQAPPAEEAGQKKGAKNLVEAPPVVLPDPETTGAKAPAPPPPPDPNAAAAPPARKPSEAAADIIRNQRSRRT